MDDIRTESLLQNPTFSGVLFYRVIGELSILVMKIPPCAGILIVNPSSRELMRLVTLGKLKDLPSPEESSLSRIWVKSPPLNPGTFKLISISF